MRPRPVRGLAPLALALACAGAGARTARAQLRTDLDAAASLVRYAGFLTSWAATVTPSLAWRSPRATLAARGTFLMFESGNTSLQGLVSAAAFTGPAGPVRLEAGAEAGASAYASYAHFSHALARVRLHALGEHWGIWGGPLAGGISSDGDGRAVTGLAAGWWGRVSGARLDLTWTSVAVGDTTFGDLQARAEWSRGALDAEASLGRRTASRGGPSGAYGDGSLALRLGTRTSLVVAAGRYPSDPVSGSIAGRFVTAGFRVALRPEARVAPLRSAAPDVSGRAAPGPPPLDGVRAALEEQGGRRYLVVRAEDARTVEVMGDFTDWQPLTLAPAGHGLFRCARPLGTGLYRFNVRLDGGSWGVPQGIAAVADEFGSSVGLLAVP